MNPGLDPRVEAKLTHSIARTPYNHHVVWTGYPRASRAGSLFERALACMPEIGKPVPLRTLLQRAAAAEAGCGLDPDVVRNAIRAHQSAPSATYLLVERRPSNDYVAVTDIPRPAGARGRISAGDVIIGARGGSPLVLMRPEAALAVS